MSNLLSGADIIPHNIIKTDRDIRPCTVKRLATIDGNGTAAGLGYPLQIGQGVLVDMHSPQYCEIENRETGRKSKQTIINIVDINGKVLGAAFAECFFDRG
jgi:hypothetical protein